MKLDKKDCDRIIGAQVTPGGTYDRARAPRSGDGHDAIDECQGDGRRRAVPRHRTRRWTCPAPRSRPGWRWRIFWVLGATVFYQFFTRYVLNDSAAWTEEIARYLLIAMVFVGAAHRRGQEQPHPGRLLLPLHAARGMARVMSTVVDVLRIAFFAAAVGADGADDAEAGQPRRDDDRRHADELRVRRVPVRLGR